MLFPVLTLFPFSFPTPPIVLRYTHGTTRYQSVTAQAVDGDFNSQPEKSDGSWNVLGVIINHWSQSKVTLDPSIAKGKAPVTKPQPPAGYWRVPDVEGELLPVADNTFANLCPTIAGAAKQKCPKKRPCAEQ